MTIFLLAFACGLLLFALMHLISIGGDVEEIRELIELQQEFRGPCSSKDSEN